MSNTSDQTTQQSKTRLIVGEIGVDTETGIIGKGHSYDNGKTFVVDDTIYGRIYHDNDHNQIWKGIQDKVKMVAKPAIDSANSAQSAADAAIASAQVTSDAMSDIASATAEAKQGANDAMSQAKSAWDAAQSNVNLIDSSYASASAAIEQNKQVIALKADQTAVDKINGTVSQLRSSLTVQAEQIQEKVTSSQVTGMLTGYATQEYAQGLVTLKADEWNANLTSVKNGLTQSYTNLSATVDGIKSTVATKADQSTVTQLSNLIQTKVSSDDFNSQITQLSDDINLRVKSADLISQINLQAGTTLIQSNKLVLDAGTTVFTGDAFIPSAAISSISADKIMLGSSALWNTDGTLNLVNQSNNLKALMQVKQGLVQNTTHIVTGKQIGRAHV